MTHYSLEEFKSLVDSDQWTYFNERRPFKHLEKLGWESDQLVDVLCALSPNDFRKTFHDQIVNDLPGVEILAADHYVIHWDVDEWVRRSNEWVQRHGSSFSTIELSIKIAIVEESQGKLAGVVTFHLSGSWD